MNLNKDVSSWSVVKAETVMTMSPTAIQNVLTMALQDIQRLGHELERHRTALAPFADYGRGSGKMPKDMQLTQGSRMAKRQLVMGDCQDAAIVMGLE